ncbi:MAG: carbohydrate ABC transporter substrate-binding protein [Candidatus Pacebacteria bacterium]|nr:carbohydrate ABC transporter substrate-binding protein [Candidatus Paceibacterota bacterium]MBP9842397.1 carbohydrate ABC transporter substrate-binding protein [Candidatus Paceibacterota bacterium]
MKLRPFELGLVVVFLGLIITALIFLSAYKKPENTDGPVVGVVSIWGVLPQEVVAPILSEIIKADEAYDQVSYRSVEIDRFNDELVNALADGQGPDIILISHEQLVEMRRRIQPISYESFPIRDIKNIYIDGAQIFTLSDGLYAYPIAVDPLVMYWNRDLVTTDGFLEAPETWEEMVNEYLPTLIRRNPDRSITRSVVAFGEYGNVRNGFGIISMLLMQAGTKGVVDEKGPTYRIELNQSSDGSSEPLRVVSDFYTRFSKPTNSLYSWNRSFSSDLDRFISGELVFYFGYASEGPEIERRNPNLSFDIAEVPQGAASTVRRTYGRFYGLAALRSSDNLTGVSAVLKTFGGKDVSEKISKSAAMVPVFRGSVSGGSNDTYGRISFKSATIAFGWLNPKLSKSNEIFQTLTEDINENRRDVSGAANDVIERLEQEYN